MCVYIDMNVLFRNITTEEEFSIKYVVLTYNNLYFCT